MAEATDRLLPLPRIEPEYIRVSYRNFGRPVEVVLVERGATVAEAVSQAAGVHASRSVAAVGNWIVPRALWRFVRPKHSLTVRVIPRDPGTWAAIFGAITKAAVAIAPTLASWGASYGAVLGGALGVGGTAMAGLIAFGAVAAIGLGVFALSLLGRLFVSAGSQNIPSITSSPSLIGSRNQISPYGPLWRVYGEYRIVAPLAMRPFTDTDGNDQYITVLLALGRGPLIVDTASVKVGDTLLSSFDPNNYQLEVREGRPGDAARTMASKTILETQVDAELVGGRQHAEVLTPATRTTELDTDEISLEFHFPMGLIKVGGHGNDTLWVDLLIEYRAVGSPTWLPMQPMQSIDANVWVDYSQIPPGRISPAVAGLIAAGGLLRVSAKKHEEFRCGVRFVPPVSGQYEVRISPQFVRIVTGEIGEQNFFMTRWASLRSIRNEDPIKESNIATLAIRLRADQNLQGVLDSVSVVVRAELEDWNPQTSTWAVATTSGPAAAALDMLRGVSNAARINNSRIDLTSFADWSLYCAANGFTFNCVYDFSVNGGVMQALRDVAAVGRAKIIPIDGRWSVVIDRERTLPVQHFTPRNSWGFVASKPWNEIPHALKVRYASKALDYLVDERIVYQDGYSAVNATRFDTLDAFGVNNSDLAFRYGRFFLRQLALRPEIFKLNAGIDALRCQVGDMVKVTHDAALWGIGWGRVKSLVLSGANVVGVQMDETYLLETLKTYAIRFRLSNGTSLLAQLVSPVSNTLTDQLDFTAPLSPPNAPSVGDLFQFGESTKESTELIVASIEYEADLTAQLTLFDHGVFVSGSLFDTESESIPVYDPGITSPVSYERRQPADPIVLAVRSDVYSRTDSASLQAAFVMTVRPGIQTPTRPAATSYFEAQFRETDPADPTIVNAWSSMPYFPGAYSQLTIGPVRQEGTYEIRIRSVSTLGVPSPWVSIVGNQILSSVDPPTSFQASVRTTLLGSGVVPTVRLTWLAPTGIVGHYVLSYRVNQGQWQFIPAVPGNLLQWDLTGIPYGTYDFRIQVYGVNDELSSYVEIPSFVFSSATVFGGVAVTGLQVLGGGTAWAGRDCQIEWALNDVNNIYALFKDYVLRVFDPSTNVDPVLATTLRLFPTDWAELNENGLPAGRFNYAYDMNFLDGGPRNRVGFEVRVRSTDGSLSAPTYLDAVNAVPAAVSSFTLGASGQQISVDLVPAALSADFKDFVAYVSQFSGFSPLTPPIDMITIFSTSPFFGVPVPLTGTWYVRVAARDVLTGGPAGLNISTQQSVLVSSISGIGPRDTKILGVATGSSASNELTDASSAPFSATLVGAKVVITSGVENGSVRLIQAIVTRGVADDTLVVGAPWDTPSAITGSTYEVYDTDISDGVLDSLHLINGLRASDIRGGVIQALIKLGVGQNIELDGVGAFLRVLDKQTVPVERVKLGRLGASQEDYGLVIKDSIGATVLDADGLGLQVVGTVNINNDSVSDVSIFQGTATTGQQNFVTMASVVIDAGDGNGKIAVSVSLLGVTKTAAINSTILHIVIGGISVKIMNNAPAGAGQNFTLMGIAVGQAGLVTVELRGRSGIALQFASYDIDMLVLATKR